MDLSRTELLIGADGLKKLGSAGVAVFGLGGVGGHAFESLVRAGIGRIHIVDFDTVQPSNMNRQILATEKTLGMKKTDAALLRAREINPSAVITASCERITPENAAAIIPGGIGFAVDAIDELDPKISLIIALRERGIFFVTSMGAGNKLSAEGMAVADIGSTTHCPLARRVRKKLREAGIDGGVTCIYSPAAPEPPPDGRGKTRTVGSISYVPGMFGLAAAGVIIRKILG